MNYPALLLSLGTLFFSASLYGKASIHHRAGQVMFSLCSALVLTGVKRLGVVAPVGGLLMAAGWFAMAF